VIESLCVYGGSIDLVFVPLRIVLAWFLWMSSSPNCGSGYSLPFQMSVDALNRLLGFYGYHRVRIAGLAIPYHFRCLLDAPNRLDWSCCNLDVESMQTMLCSFIP
jgi:hypothetical protein